MSVIHVRKSVIRGTTFLRISKHYPHPMVSYQKGNELNISGIDCIYCVLQVHKNFGAVNFSVK